MERERLGNRSGFIMLSAGCAIGCGNVWKFPWMVGENGGGAFVLVYLICLLVLGLPALTLEFAIVLCFLILSVNLQGGLERVTKYMMSALLVLMVVLVIKSGTLPGAAKGYAFYLVPDFSKISFSVVASAMNRAFFTLSIGIGSMAIFGSYIGKERSLLGESISIIVLDTFVAIMAGLFLLSLTTALGYSIWQFHPFGEGTAWLDFWDFIVSANLLPLGALVMVLFCTGDRLGWGWENFMNEANQGKGLKIHNWMKPIYKYVVPIIVIVIYLLGIRTYFPF